MHAKVSYRDKTKWKPCHHQVKLLPDFVCGYFQYKQSYSHVAVYSYGLIDPAASLAQHKGDSCRYFLNMPIDNLLNLPAVSNSRWGSQKNCFFMPEPPEDKRTRNYILMRTLMDVGMGIIYIGVSLFIIFGKRLGFSLAVFEPPFSYWFGGICIAYGLFRVYRGVKKNYFRS
jgi:hypothetical protein